MHFNEELVNELNILVKFNLDSIQEGIKIHHTAGEATIAAAQRLFDKGFISQKDGGYLTDLGRELIAKIAPKSIERYIAIEEKFGVRKLELLYELLDDLIQTLEESD